MADTIQLNIGTGGAVLNTDDIAGTHTQIVKVGFGALDSLSLVTTASPLPVDLRASNATVTVSGSVTVSGDVTNAGTFAVQATGNAASAAADSGNPVKVGGKLNTTKPTFTDGQRGDLQVDTRGNLNVSIYGANSATSVYMSDNADTLAVSANGATIRSGALAFLYNGTQWDRMRGDITNGLDVDVTRVTGTVTIAGAVTNAGTFVVQENGTQVQVDDAAFTPATSKIVMAGYEADEGSTDSVDEGDGGAARMTLDRKQIVTLQPHTAGGLTTAMFSGSDGSSILVATAQVIKASAGQVYGYYLYNPEAAVTFVHFYNTAQASVTVGTTNPLFTLAVPAGAAANVAIPQGITFSNAGFSIAATTTAGGNTAPATGVSAVVWYM